MDEFQGLFDAAGRATINPPQSRAADRRLVRAAIDAIDARLDEALQIGGLCTELNTSWRTLERAFLRLLGMPPKRYIQLARLAEARRLLLQYRRTGCSVAEIASACGISHLGRFSQAYRSTYGELPSQTLRQ
jgi:transcriptional regulator GlxA family with amidase domain